MSADEPAEKASDEPAEKASDEPAEKASDERALALPAQDTDLEAPGDFPPDFPEPVRVQLQTAPADVRALLVSYVYRHSGPLPDPAMLSRYERALPGLAKVLVGEFQAEAKHRRSLDRQAQDNENRALDANIALSHRGMSFAGALALTGFALVAFGFYLGLAAAGVTFGSTVLVGLVTAFLYSRKKQADEARQDRDTEIRVQSQRKSPRALPSQREQPSALPSQREQPSALPPPAASPTPKGGSPKRNGKRGGKR